MAASRIVVAGMHRSGTSLVARALHLAGVSLGPPEDLMPAKEDNPTGFWENLTAVQINDDLLAQLGGSWQVPRFVEDGWETREDIAVFRSRISALVKADFAGNGPVAWKDPRLSLLLPLWRDVAQVDAVVLVMRDPRAVGRSIAQRKELDEAAAALLWTRYTSELLRAWPEPTLVEYTDFLASPLDEMARLCAELGLPGVAGSAAKELLAFAQPSLRHHTADGPPESEEMFEALRLQELIRHAPALARIEAQRQHDAWRIGVAGLSAVALRQDAGVLRERLALKDEELLRLERTVDRMVAQATSPPTTRSRHNAPSGLKKWMGTHRGKD